MKDNQAKYPQLRFKGFTYPWEKRYLGDYVVDYTEKTTQENQFPVLTSSQQQGIVLQSEYFSDRQVTTDENIGYFVLPRGYFTYRSRSDNNIFVFNRNDIIDKGIISYFYPVFGLINVDSNFFLRRINNGLNRQLAIAAEGTGQHVLSLKKFKKMETRFPSLPEQKQIGEFLECLDDLITVNQRKLAKLKELKQGYLQKLFPKNGSKFPQLRFSGFADAWEQRKLGDLAEIVRGASPRPIQNPKWFDDSSEIGWLRISDVTAQDGRIHRLEQHISVEGQEKTRVLTTPHLLLSIAATVGKPVINYISTGVHDGFLIFLKPRFELEFMFQWLENFRSSWQRYGQPGSQVNLNSGLVRKQTIYIPTREEQQKIAGFCEKLDNLITLHQRKLEKLQELKKGYLQKMFC